MSPSDRDVADVSTVTTQTLQKMKRAGVPIAMLTAYDYTSARLLDHGGADVLLVGDSAANVMAGHETTLPITLDQMVYHAQCVVRGADRAMVVVDLPFGSFQGGPADGLEAAVRVMKETGARGVKLEGARVDTVRRIVQADIPVMGHLGLTPQSIHEFGSFSVQAREDDEAERLIEDARRLEEAGCFAVVLEMIPASLAQTVAEELTVPTIGIGAGAGTDGQVLVMHDALGLTRDFTPGFVRQYADLGDTITDAVEQYVRDVRDGEFPSDDESY